MGAASESLKSRQQFLSCSRETDKYAFSEARSDNFVVGKNSPPDATVDSLGSPSSKHSSQVFTRTLSVTDVSPQFCCHTQNDVIIELLRHLKGVIIKFEDVVKGSPQFENKSIQVGAGSPILSVSSNQDEVHFCEYSGQNKPQDFEVAVEKEVKLASAVNENNIVDVSESNTEC